MKPDLAVQVLDLIAETGDAEPPRAGLAPIREGGRRLGGKREQRLDGARRGLRIGGIDQPIAEGWPQQRLVGRNPVGENRNPRGEGLEERESESLTGARKDRAGGPGEVVRLLPIGVWTGERDTVADPQGRCDRAEPSLLPRLDRPGQLQAPLPCHAGEGAQQVINPFRRGDAAEQDDEARLGLARDVKNPRQVDRVLEEMDALRKVRREREEQRSIRLAAGNDPGSRQGKERRKEAANRQALQSGGRASVEDEPVRVENHRAAQHRREKRSADEGEAQVVEMDDVGVADRSAEQVRPEADGRSPVPGSGNPHDLDATVVVVRRERSGHGPGDIAPECDGPHQVPAPHALAGQILDVAFGPAEERRVAPADVQDSEWAGHGGPNDMEQRRPPDPEVAPATSRTGVERPRVVYVTADWPWPPTSGGRLQALHLAEALRETHDVVVLATDRVDERFPAWTEAVSTIRRRRASQLHRLEDAVWALAAGRQVLLQRMLRSEGPRAFAAVLDAVRPEFVILGRPIFDDFVEVVLARSIPLVIEANEDLLRVSRSIMRHGATARARVIAAVDSLVVGRMQRRNYPLAAQVIVCSPVEAQILGRAARIERLAVVPNVVSLGPRPEPAGEITSLGFLGSFGYAPNEAAALELVTEILPRVVALGGPNRALLVGRDPTPSMRRAAAAHPGARITGEVADPLAELWAAGILVVPLRSGAGTRVKILEAAAAGIPIVSTPFGVEGLALRHGVEVLLASEPDDIAAAVMRLHEDPMLRTRLSSAARDAVERLYSIEAGRRAMRAALEPISPVLQSFHRQASLDRANPRGRSR